MKNDLCASAFRGFSALKNGFGWFAPMLLRIVLADLFIESGWHKFTHVADTVEFFTSLGIPLASLQVPFVAAVEFIGGIALLVGFFVEVAVVPLMGTMVVALITAKRGEIQSVTSLTEITEFLYLCMLLALGALGAGCFSVDQILRRKSMIQPS